MPAVVRIKRRIDEEPLSTFILNSKKRRRLGDSEGALTVEGDENAAAAIDVEAGGDRSVADKDDEISTVLKFAGTIQEQDDGATTQLARLTKEAAKELVQQKSARQPSNYTERARQEMRQALHENRFRVVNCMRKTLEDTDAAEAVKEVTIVDIEKQEVEGDGHVDAISTSTNDRTLLTQSGSQEKNSETIGEGAQFQQPTDSDTGYVYDLYLPENEWQMEYGDMMDDNYLSVRPYDDLFYEDRFNDDDEDEDSEDSNNENYYTNDYPDEDDNNEDYLDSYDHADIDAMALGLRDVRLDIPEEFIDTFFEDDVSSVSECEDSSDDCAYYDDYYEAGGNSDSS